MSINIANKVKNYMKSFFPSFEYEEVLIRKKVIADVIDLAKQAYPREFIILLKGNIENKKLEITSLIYQTYQASSNATAVKMNLPLISNVYGSCHGHPGFRNRPSRQDLRFFNKYPGIHLIICRPHTARSIAAYDANGNKIDFRII